MLGYYGLIHRTKGNSFLKPGDIRYKNTNGDDILDWRDQVEIGKGDMPHWMGGLNIALSYKNFDLQTLLQGAWDFTQQINLFWGSHYSLFVYENRWTPENNKKDALVPRLSGAPSNNLTSDFWCKNSSYLRMKVLSLGYNLPKSLTQKAGIENIRLSISGTNIFTISGLNKYSLDPEAPNGLGGKYYPQPQTVSFSLNLSL